MLDIVASYHCMQFQGKLMKQTWENRKKSSFGTDFDPLTPKFDPPPPPPNKKTQLFHVFYPHCMLDIVANYHWMQLRMSSDIPKFQTWWL